MNEVPEKKKSHRFIFICACIVTFIALLYAEENWRTRHELNKFESHWAAQGEKFDLNDIVPPSVPDDENFAMAPIWVESVKASLGPERSRQWFGDNYAENGQTNFVNRFDMSISVDDNDWRGHGGGSWQKATLTDLKSWQDYYRTLAAGTNLFPVSAQPQTPAQDVLLALSKYDPAIEELRQAAERPDSRFPVDYNEQPPASILLPHLAMLKRCTLVLELRAVAELQNGETDQAMSDIQLMLRLIGSIRAEPFLISHLVRVAMLQYALQPVYEGLAEHKWTDAQLAKIDAGLAPLDFLADYEFSFSAERALELANIEYLRRTRDFSMLDFSDNDTHHHSFSDLAYHLAPNSFFYQNELTLFQMDQQYVLSSVDLQNRTVSPLLVRQNNAAETNALNHFSYSRVMARILMPTVDTAVKKFTYAQESVDLSRTAIALERYRLAHGEYPVSLDALPPQYMKEVPHDIIGGQPLQYFLTGMGQFVLYSVGWNQTDDGGTIVSKMGQSGFVDINQGDWVWRYPAK